MERGKEADVAADAWEKMKWDQRDKVVVIQTVDGKGKEWLCIKYHLF